jgi:hypothetical protein
MAIETANAQTTMSFTPIERGLILAPKLGGNIEELATEIFPPALCSHIAEYFSI